MLGTRYMFKDIRVSSAKNRLVERLTHRSMSLTKRIHNRGPKTVPFGTPLIIINY